MKKLLVLAGFAACVCACNNDTATNSSVESDTTTHAAGTPPAAYTATEGDVTYRDGKVMVWKNNEWVAADNDVTLNDGVVVRRNGRVERDGDTVELEDGEVVSRTGRFFDKAGNAIEDGWDATKKGAKKSR